MSRIFPFSEGTSIAFKSMVILSSSYRPLSIAVISKAINSSPHHVAKVLQKLAFGGFVQSKAGPKGGFSINKSIHRITLFDIYQCIEGTEKLESLINLKRQTNDPVPVEKLTIDISSHFITFLKNHSVAMYAKKQVLADHFTN